MKTNYYKIILVFMFVIVCPHEFINAQSNESEAILYNIGIASIFSGIGAVINKKQDEDFNKVFLKGLAQGAVGGAVVYKSKTLLRNISDEKDLGYSWPAKLVNSLGISIIENASLNRNFWEQVNVHIGFNRIEIHTTEKIKIRYKLMPAAFLLTVEAAIDNKFEIEKSLKAGEFIFSSNNFQTNQDVLRMGEAGGPAIVLNDSYKDSFQVFSHELVHVYQYNNFIFFNSYLKKPLERKSTNSNFLQKLQNIVYWDFHAPIYLGLYNIEKKRSQTNFDNWFEKEAEYYSN